MRGPTGALFGAAIAFSVAHIQVGTHPCGPTAGLVKAAAAEPGAGANLVSGLLSRVEGDKTVVVLRGSATPSFTAYRLPAPPRLVVDMANGRLGLPAGETRQVQVDTWAVGQISIDERVGDATQVVRMIIGLKRESTYTVRARGSELVVTIVPDEVQPVTRPPLLVAPAVVRKPELSKLLLPGAGIAAPEAPPRVAVDPDQAERVTQAKKELAAAQKQATALHEQVAQAHRQLEETEARRQQTEKAREAEEGRLQALRAAQQKTEAEQVRQTAEVQRLGQKQVEMERTRQAEEARLVALRAEQKKAETEQAQKTAEVQRLAQKKVEMERARQAEEARLVVLRAEQKKAEAEQAERTRKAAAEPRLYALRAEQKKAEAEQAQKTAEVQRLAQKKAEMERARQAEEARLYAVQAEQKKAEAERHREQASVAVARKIAPPKQAARVEAEDRVDLPSFAGAPWAPLRRAVTLRPYAREPVAVAEDSPARREPVVTFASAGSAAPEPSKLRLPGAGIAAARLLAAATPGGPVMVSDVRFEDDGQIERVIIDLSGGGVETSVYTDSHTAVLRLIGAQLSPSLARTLDTTAYNGPVQAVSSFPDPRNSRAVRLVVSMSRKVAPRLSQKGGHLLWEFPRPIAGFLLPFRSFPPARFARFGNPSIPLQVIGGDKGQLTSSTVVGRNGKRYNGRRIDLDFKDADIHNILRLLSDVGQVNIVTADDVKGAVTIRMKDVPWDQAMDVILRAKGLGYVREGNLLRVAPQDRLDKESESEAARLRNKVELQPLETRLIPLSYASGTAMEKRVHDVLSPRGKVSFDERTNILIISDLSANIALAEDLLRNLDTQTPQVLIEARIIEANATFSRGIGIQWGFGGEASVRNGNPTGLAFPANVGVAGGTDQTGTQGLTFNAANPQYAVNLPAASGLGKGGALGLALGSLNGAYNINLRLSAFEDTGNVRTISAPKIITSDNYSASIESGTAIPVSVVSAAGANTQFFDAKLNLTVKPHVTNEGAVLMDINVTRNEPNTGITSANGTPAITKRQARTQMLVRDGDTAVIGGIYTRNTGQAYHKVPVLGDIPILGWLFKTKTENDDRAELLIFITPRILNRTGAIAPSQLSGPGAGPPAGTIQ